MLQQQVDSTRAMRQFEDLVNTYCQLGVQVEILEQDPELPDMVFTANAGLLLGDTFVPSNFRYPERARESEIFATYFSATGFAVKRIEPSIPFEGTGDAIFLGDTLMFGYGFRSSRKAASELAQYAPQTSIVALGLSNPYFYHLDTCFAPLPSGRFLYYPDAFDDRSRLTLEAMNGYWVAERFCVRYGCNLMVIGETVITSCVDDRLQEIARLEGLCIRELDVSEFVKSGGGVRCLSLRF